MPAIESRRRPEELARVGAGVFKRRVRPAIRPEDDNKFIAIDLGSGDYGIDEDDDATVSPFPARRPSAEVWLERAGQPATYRLGRPR